MPETISIPPIQLGNVLPGAKLLDPDDKGINETYIGMIETPAGRIRAYIKVLSQKQLVNELVCNTIGRALDFPIPDGYLVRVTKSELPDSVLLSDHEGEAIVFAVADVGLPSLKRRLKEVGQEFLAQFFTGWKNWEITAIFDEWVANIDRNPGNLLVEGPNKVWLIDHGHSFTGPDWSPEDLQADIKVVNKIADLCFPNLTLPKRMDIRKNTDELCRYFDLINANDVLINSHSNRFLNSTELVALIEFIQQRVSKLLDLVSDRLGIPNIGV